MGRCELESAFRCAASTGVVELSGELDIATAPALAAILADAVEALPDGALLVVDLAEVLFCGARGFTLLLDAADHLAARGGRLVLIRRPDLVRRLMDLVDVPHRPHPVDPAAVELIPRRAGSGTHPPLR